MASIKKNRFNRYMLSGSLKKNGFDRWRFVCNGISTTTGEEKAFLIEFYYVNPSLSPQECVLGFKSRLVKSEENLQYALAGTQAAAAPIEEFVHPSYLMVKAGCLSRGGKQVNAYFPSAHVQTGHKDIVLRAGDGDSCCQITDKGTKGSVFVKYAELMEKPELLCNAGVIDWDLTFEHFVDATPSYIHKNMQWAVVSPDAAFTGKIHLDGEEFIVSPQTSCGYIDKNWGRDFPSPFFHLSSANLTSMITGKYMQKSCFAVQGEYNEKLSVFATLGDRIVEFSAAKNKKYIVTYECTETPRDDEGVKVHWTVSVHNRNTVMDIDIFCNTDDMFVRDYESPAGGRKVMKVLGGGTGSGELRLYHYVKKNLELIEHVTVTKAVCEFGNFEFPEK